MRGIVVAAALAALGSLAACAEGPGLIVMKNPKTGEVAQCQADPWLHWDPYAATESCAKGYESAGWQRASTY